MEAKNFEIMTLNVGMKIFFILSLLTTNLNVTKLHCVFVWNIQKISVMGVAVVAVMGIRLMI
jgi:hypothetical protein